MSASHPSAQAANGSPSLRVLTLNCWGLKWLSKHRAARLQRIGEVIATYDPPLQVVALQECWTQQDYESISQSCRHVLPYAKFYFSGAFGGGLAILSAYPIIESNMFKYPLNGQPAAFYRGDWFVGKGVASARIQLPRDIYGDGRNSVLEVFCTHLHAPYKPEHLDSYVTHRTAQAWEISRLMRHAVERGHLVLGCGDFNMRPKSLAHQLIETHGHVKDVWRLLFPDSSLGAVGDPLEKARLEGLSRDKRGWDGDAPGAEFNVRRNGATCDSAYNTWRWNKGEQTRLDKGDDVRIPPETPDHSAKRLDYIFLGGTKGRSDDWEWRVESAEVGMMERHPTLKCSLSDHFSVEAVLRLEQRSPSSEKPADPVLLPSQTYSDIAEMVASFTDGEYTQALLRNGHFFLQAAVSIGCLVAVWWAPHNYVSFILMLVSTLGFGAGVVNGLIGLLFVRNEVRALKEFAWEIETTRQRAVAAENSAPHRVNDAAARDFSGMIDGKADEDVII